MKNDINIDDEMKIRIRHTATVDLPDVLVIEQDNYGEPWSKGDFVQWRNQRDADMLVVEHDEQIIGFMVYESRLGKLRIVNIAVADVFHRRGVGTQLIDKLIAKLRPDSPRSIVAIVRETNDAAISFFAKLGFHGTKILREHYDDSPEDAYRLEWKLAGHREIASRETETLDNRKETN